MLLSRCEPVSDATGVTVTLGVRDRLADEIVWGDPETLTASGRVSLRGRGKAVTLRVSVPAGATWSYLRGIEFPDGAIVKGGR